MKNEEKYKLYRAGFNEAVNHQKPSPETKNFMEETRENITQMKIDIQKLKDNTESIAISLAEIKANVNDFIKSADNKYAGKWVEAKVNSQEDKSNSRNYEWLKWLIMFTVATLSSVLINHLIK